MAKGKRSKNNKKKNGKKKNRDGNSNDVIPSTVPDVIITRSDDDNNNHSEFQQQQEHQQEEEHQQDRIEAGNDNQSDNKKSAIGNAAAATPNTIYNDASNQDDNNNEDNVDDDVNNDEILILNSTNISNISNITIDRSGVNEFDDDNDNDDNNNGNLRQGTISSARFNILCTMVGGGSLSVPLAFEQSGALLIAPIVLFISAVITEFCFRIIIECTRKLHKQRQRQQRRNGNDDNDNSNIVGNDTYESIAGAAFGQKGFVFAKALVTLMCFAATIGYAVLLRDMMQPVTDFFVANNKPGPTTANNITMWIIVILITPVCTLKNLTSLKDLGAASMAAILVLVACVTFRSIQCNFPNGIAGSSKYVPNPPYRNFDWDTIYNYYLFPQIAVKNNATAVAVFFAMLEQLLNVFPLYVSVYVCHYNLPPVQNELKSPTKERVGTWLRTTTWSATLFYLIIGISGSMYANCIPDTELPLKGNILLSLNENDPILFIGRMCLAVTITLAFPLLTVPARDILLRTFFPLNIDTTAEADVANDVESSLRQPLLMLELEVEEENNGTNNNYQRQRERESNHITVAANNGNNSTNSNDHSFAMRLSFAVLIFWSGVAVASCVDGIDTVWDLLGSSLSIILCFLIPAGSYIIISNNQSSFLRQSEHDNYNDEEDNDGRDDDDEENDNCFGYSKDKLSMVASWALVWIYIPMMIISTINAFYKTFFS